MPVVRVLQLVDDQPQGEDLLVDLRVGGQRVHGHLRVPVLTGQTVGGDSRAVPAPLPPVPAVGGHLVLARPDIRVLAEDVRQLGPEPLRVLDRGQDVVDEVVDVTAGGRRYDTGGGRVVVTKPAAGSSPSKAGVSTILKHLKYNYY